MMVVLPHEIGSNLVEGCFPTILLLFPTAVTVALTLDEIDSLGITFLLGANCRLATIGARQRHPGRTPVLTYRLLTARDDF